jgi:hypothetical protein
VVVIDVLRLVQGRARASRRGGLRKRDHVSHTALEGGVRTARARALTSGRTNEAPSVASKHAAAVMHPGRKYGFARQNGVSSAEKRAAGSANIPPSSGLRASASAHGNGRGRRKRERDGRGRTRRWRRAARRGRRAGR